MVRAGRGVLETLPLRSGWKDKGGWGRVDRARLRLHNRRGGVCVGADEFWD